MTEEMTQLDLDAMLEGISDNEPISKESEPAAKEPDPVSKASDPVPTPENKSYLSIYDDADTTDIFLEKSELKQQSKVPPLSEPWMKHHEFIRVETIEHVNQVIDEAIASGKASLDLETEGFDNRIRYDSEGKPYTVHKIVGFCIAYGDAKKGFYIPIRHQPTDDGPDLNVQPIEAVEAAISRLCHAAQPVLSPDETDKLSGKKWLEAPKVAIDFWNAKFDQEFLYPITGIDWWHPDSYEDGYLACYVVFTDDKHLGLKPKSAEKLKDPDGNPYKQIEMDELFLKGMAIKFHLLAPDEVGTLNYACSDAVCTRLLGDHPEVVAKVKSKREWASTYRIEKQTTQVVRVMERNRIKVDRPKVRTLFEPNAIRLEEIRNKIVKLAESHGFHNLDPASPKQIGEFLFEPTGLNITPKTDKHEKSGQYKTDEDSLDELVKENPGVPDVIKWILEFRGYEKLRSTYLEGLLNNPDENDELRFDFKQTGTQTARFTAPAREVEHGFSGIPIHGIPNTSELRTVFIARPGYTMVKADYAGEELRIVANISGEPVWVNEFLHGSGDLHSITARAFFNKQDITKDERKMGKCVHPDTLIWVNDRLITMSDLTYPEQEDSFLDIENAKVYNGSEWKPLSATFNGGTKSLFHVVLSGGLLTCTSEHRFGMHDGRLVRTEDLQPGDVVEQVTFPQIQDYGYSKLRIDLWEGIPAGYYDLNHDYAYFAGLFAGDGTGQKSSATLAHGASEKLDAYDNPFEDWIKVLEESCYRCGFTISRKDFAQLYLGSTVFVRFLSALGIQRKHQKRLRIPSWILSAGKQAILYYLGGLFDTDGTVGTHSPNLDWTTKDFVFAGQIATAMRGCGLDFNVELTFNKIYERYYVRLRLTVESSWALQNYMKHEGKKSRLRAPIYDGRTKNRFEVTKILPAGDLPCVDITVEGSHIYLANGFVTHNTANFALVYGGGPASIVRATGCERAEAARRKQAFDRSVPVFAAWVKNQQKNVKKNKGIVNAFGRWIAIPDAAIKAGETTSRGKTVEEKDANAIRAACERHSINFPIQSGGSDIMKLAMILLHKELWARGWLRSNGDDSVRMLLTVHDEIVFEIRHDRVPEAIEIICDRMSKPKDFVNQKFSPPWQIPLVVEPLIGLSWGGEYDYGKLMHGEVVPYKEVKDDQGNVLPEKLKPYEVRIGDKIFHRVPPWLEGIMEIGKKAPFTLVTGTPSPSKQDVETSSPSTPKTASVAPKTILPPAPATQTPSIPPSPVGVKSVPPKAESVGIVTFKLALTTRATIRQVRCACAEFCASWSGPGERRTLRLMDAYDRHVLIDPSLGVVIAYEAVIKKLKEMNLTDGKFEVS